MRKVLALLAAVAFVAFSGNLMADDAKTVPGSPLIGQPAPVVSAPLKLAPLGMGLTVIGVGVGLGLIGFGAMGGIARQPEQAGNIRTAMLIIGGLVEGAGIIALVLCFVV